MVLNLTGGNINQNNYYSENNTMNFMGTLSPPSSSVDSSDMSMSSPGMLAPQLLYQIDNCSIIERTEPYIQILEQPVEKFRFRYKSEMSGTHGSLNGISSDKLRKNTYPTVQLLNYSGPAIIRCALYQINVPQPHPHRLIIKDSKETELDDPHDIRVSEESHYIATFQGMGIIHTAKVNLVNELFMKKKSIHIENLKQNGVFRDLTKQEFADIKSKAEREAKSINLNIVRLRFDALREENGRLIPICEPVYTHGINNLKSALTGELKIVRMDLTCGSCMGGQEIFMLVEKVVKHNIQIRFFLCDEDDNEIWCDYGKFSSVDVHHQYAIVFKTPPYRDPDIESMVEVCIELVRPSDGARSEPRIYRYKPSEKIGRKRYRCHDSVPSVELPTTLCNLSLPNSESGKLNSSDMENIDSEEFNNILEKMFPVYEKICTEPDNEKMCSESVYFDFDKLIKTDGPVNASSNTKQNFDATKILAIKVCKELERLLKEKERPDADILEHRVLKLFNDLKTDDGNNALHTSILCEQFTQLQYFLILLSKMKHLKILDIKNNDGDTALHIAVKMNNTTVLHSLLNVGADPNIVNNNGNTALHAVLLSENYNTWESIIDELITENNINKENDDGKIPLHLAVLNKNLDCVKKLVAKKANVNKINNANGSTILHFAIEEQCVDIVNYLLTDAGARYDIENYNKITPYQLAKILSEKNNENAKLIYNIMTNYLHEHGFTDLVIKTEPYIEEDSTDSEEPTVKIELMSPENVEREDCNIQLSADDIAQLSEILDNTVYLSLLSKELNFANIGQNLTTKILFTYIQINEIPITKVLSILKNINATDAVKVIENSIQY